MTCSRSHSLGCLSEDSDAAPSDSSASPANHAAYLHCLVPFWRMCCGIDKFVHETLFFCKNVDSALGVSAKGWKLPINPPSPTTALSTWDFRARVPGSGPHSRARGESKARYKRYGRVWLGTDTHMVGARETSVQGVNGRSRTHLGMGAFLSLRLNIGLPDIVESS